MNNQVVMVRTIGGEFIIGTEELVQVMDAEGNPSPSNESVLKLKNARMFSLQMTHQGTAIAFIPPFPFSSKKELIDDIELNKSCILLKVEEKDLDGEIINGYKSNISGIDLSAANKVVI